MTELKFTPGPWNNCDGETIETKEARICIVAPLNLKPEESDANAALIAAAPEMYRKLEWLQREFDESDDEELVAIGWEIELILKKARGER